MFIGEFKSEEEIQKVLDTITVTHTDQPLYVPIHKTDNIQSMIKQMGEETVYDKILNRLNDLNGENNYEPSHRAVLRQVLQEARDYIPSESEVENTTNLLIQAIDSLQKDPQNEETRKKLSEYQTILDTGIQDTFKGTPRSLLRFFTCELEDILTAHPLPILETIQISDPITIHTKITPKDNKFN